LTIISGLHSVLEALKSGRELERIVATRGAGGQRLQDIINLARERHIPVRFEPRDQLDRLAQGSAHQGVVAIGRSFVYGTVTEIPDSAKLVVILDGVEDPHNLGAIIRTAHCAGADAIVIPERRSAGITDTVTKAAAGALEYLPIIRVVNLSRTLEELKKRRFWIYGLDERGTESYDRVDYGVPTGLVLGSEGEGLHDLVRRHCDALVRIPLAGRISSLNVSVAAGVVLFDWKRRYAVD
jgi:23S rRNA (guanosine2251-2'-O)-methyltransferase